jgi:hypoxanthine phosphoribosyltransferase
MEVSVLQKVPALYSEMQIHERVRALAEEISRHHASSGELLFVSVLKGSFVFTADLIRCMQRPVSIEFISVSSYEGTSSTGHVRLVQDLGCDIEGKDVVLIEDIIDTGVTVDYLLKTFSVRKPASLQVCTLLSKPSQRRMHHAISYVGFEIPNRFVVGYGMDCDGKYRELPYIGVLDGIDT